MRFSGRLTNRLWGISATLIFTLVILITIPIASLAGSLQYFYDDIGRLVKAVSDTGESAIYSYDEVGNLLSITKATLAQLPPVVSNINPDIVFTGTSTPISITGTNLLTTKTLKSDNAGITISNVSATNTTITAMLTIDPKALTGGSMLTASTDYGTASISVNVLRVTTNPTTVYMQPGGLQAVTISTYPLPPRDLNLSVVNNYSAIVTAPSSVTVPAGGSVPFTIAGVSAGSAILEAGGGKIVANVMPSFTGAGSATSPAVCVSINQLPSNLLIRSNPVNVLMEGHIAGGISSAGVNVQWLEITGAEIVSQPVCVKISAQ